MTELYKGKVGDSVDQDAVAKDEIDFLDTHGSVQRMAAFEQSSEEVADLYKEIGHSLNQDVVVKDGIEFFVTRGAAAPMNSLTKAWTERRRFAKASSQRKVGKSSPNQCGKSQG